MNDPTRLSLATLAAQISSRRLSAMDLVEAFYERIQYLAPSLNAFRHIDIEHARAQAKASDMRKHRLGSLDGIPIAVKENIDIEGLVTRSGLGPRGERPAGMDAEIIRRLRAAGAIILGHTSMHEGALGATNDNPHYGRTHNPWRHNHTPGGSSGGSAAAVASGCCPIALGTDTMGSIRLPASYCGLAGWKPGRGQIGNTGIDPLCKELDQVGPIARSVADLSLLLEAITALKPGANGIDLPSLRIARLTNVDEVDIADDVHKAFDGVLDMFQRAGIDVATTTMQACDLGHIRHAGLLLIEAEASTHFRDERKRYPDAFSNAFIKLLDYGASADEDRMSKARKIIAGARRGFETLFETNDLLVVPTAPQPAFAFDAPVPSNQADLTALANVAGAPAVSLPIGLSSEGLPIGMQVIGPCSADGIVLEAATAFEDMIGFKLPDLPHGDWI